MQMAAAVAEQRQHRPDVGRDASDKGLQPVWAGAVHFAQQFVANWASIVLEGVAA
jgi:hypothetical protein